MTRAEFKKWLEAYRQAWETRDPEVVVQLFAEDAAYQDTPFAEPMRGRPAIRAYWVSVVTRRQEQIKFGYEILAVTKNTGMARWQASFVRSDSNQPVSLDGIFLLTFDAENRCRSLQEWWMRQEGKRG
jgi:uncharacterized protein (TIGR02246 family)